MSIPLLNEKLFTFLISIKAHDKVKDFYKAMGNEGLLVSDILLLSTYTLPCHACLAMIFNTVFIRFVEIFDLIMCFYTDQKSKQFLI